MKHSSSQISQSQYAIQLHNLYCYILFGIRAHFNYTNIAISVLQLKASM